MSDMPPPLRDPEFMGALLDTLIPPSGDGRLPGAGSLGLGETVVPRIEADAMLGPVVVAGLAAVRDAALARDPAGFGAMAPQLRAEILESQLAAHPMLILGVGLHLYPAYYQHPRVLDAIGEPPRPPFPEGYTVDETDPRLLALLEARRRG